MNCIVVDDNKLASSVIVHLIGQVDFLNLSPADPVIEGIVGTVTQGVGQVTVQLYNVAVKLVASTTTSGGGYYVFRFAAPGQYTVKIVPPAAYTAANSSVTLSVKMFETVKLDFTLRP